MQMTMPHRRAWNWGDGSKLLCSSPLTHFTPGFFVCLRGPPRANLARVRGTVAGRMPFFVLLHSTDFLPSGSSNSFAFMLHTISKKIQEKMESSNNLGLKHIKIIFYFLSYQQWPTRTEKNCEENEMSLATMIFHSFDHLNQAA